MYALLETLLRQEMRKLQAKYHPEDTWYDDLRAILPISPKTASGHHIYHSINRSILTWIMSILLAFLYVSIYRQYRGIRQNDKFYP